MLKTIMKGLQLISHGLICFNLHYQFSNKSNTTSADSYTISAKKFHLCLTNFHFISISFTNFIAADYHQYTKVD